MDNGPEFAGRMLDLGAHLHRVTLEFSRPGTPTDNGFIESFNRHLREECLNQCDFTGPDDARERLEAWRIESNEQSSARSPHATISVAMASGPHARSLMAHRSANASLIGRPIRPARSR